MSPKSTLTIRIIRPSSREQHDLLAPRLDELRMAGFNVLYDDLPRDPTWPYTSSSIQLRAESLTAALTEEGTDAVLCARGGYGASDLLTHLPWEHLSSCPKKLLIGFSDVSALHAGLAAKLNWPGLHAPMPATALWQPEDTVSFAAFMRDWCAQRAVVGSLAVEPLNPADHGIEGKLFGGCFTVLTNLIGTPYMPSSLRNHIVFIEDTDEHPARLMRAFNQWLQSGLLIGAKALIVGHLRNLGANTVDAAPFVYERFAERSPIPVFKTTAFGHTTPNVPMLIGAHAQIADDGQSLTWRYLPT